MSLVSKNINQSLLLLDIDTYCQSEADVIYLWNGYSKYDNKESILDYCEKNSEHLKEKYCKWIYDLGNTLVNGVSVIEHLKLKDGFSYWWMTLLVEQSLWKSPAISDSIRLLALEEIIIKKKTNKFKLVSSNRKLNKVIASLCREMGVDYEWDKVTDVKSPQFSYKHLYRVFPRLLVSLLVSANYLRIRWPLKHSGNTSFFSGDKAVFFCSYLFNLDTKQAKKGCYYSRYWGGVHGLILGLGFKVNWLQHFTKHNVTPNAQAAMSLVEGFNRRNQNKSHHVFIDKDLSLGVVWSVFKKWLALIYISFKLREIRNIFGPQRTASSLWLLARDDWFSSIRGTVAINNLLWFELFNKVLKDIPFQKKGFYLCENQAWERAFIFSWRKNGHGKLISVPHSTRSFWDLRFYNYGFTFGESRHGSLPQADYIAVNGEASRNMFLSENYPNDSLLECEALRYEYLDDIRRCKKEKNTNLDESIRVLVLCDYTPSVTREMLEMLVHANTKITVPIIYVVKPHPNYIVKAEDYPSINVHVTNDSLSEVLCDFDVAYCSNATSAAVDAFLSGTRTVIMLNSTELNLSPLRGQQQVSFVSSSSELVVALQEIDAELSLSSECNNYFYLNSDFPRWKKLLNE